MSNLKRTKQCKAEPNVVPLCDILLVLLIIFMIATPLFKHPVNVRLPEASHAQNQPEPGSILTVSIKDNGTVYLDAVPVPDLEKLAFMLEDKIRDQKQSERKKVLLKADKEIVYGKVVQVMEEIRRAQVDIVGLVSQKEVTN